MLDLGLKRRRRGGEGERERGGLCCARIILIVLNWQSMTSPVTVTQVRVLGHQPPCIEILTLVVCSSPRWEPKKQSAVSVLALAVKSYALFLFSQMGCNATCLVALLPAFRFTRSWVPCSEYGFTSSMASLYSCVSMLRCKLPWCDV